MWFSLTAHLIINSQVNPPYYVRLVELVPHPETLATVMDVAYSLMTDVGQAPVRLRKEIDGFALNRVQYAIIAESWRLVQVGHETYTCKNDKYEIMSVGFMYLYVIRKKGRSKWKGNNIEALIVFVTTSQSYHTVFTDHRLKKEYNVFSVFLLRNFQTVILSFLTLVVLSQAAQYACITVYQVNMIYFKNQALTGSVHNYKQKAKSRKHLIRKQIIDTLLWTWNVTALNHFCLRNG